MRSIGRSKKPWRELLSLLLDLLLIQVGILLSYLARFETGLLQHSEACDRGIRIDYAYRMADGPCCCYEP